MHMHLDTFTSLPSMSSTSRAHMPLPLQLAGQLEGCWDVMVGMLSKAWKRVTLTGSYISKMSAL